MCAAYYSEIGLEPRTGDILFIKTKNALTPLTDSCVATWRCDDDSNTTAGRCRSRSLLKPMRKKDSCCQRHHAKEELIATRKIQNAVLYFEFVYPKRTNWFGTWDIMRNPPLNRIIGSDRIESMLTRHEQRTATRKIQNTVLYFEFVYPKRTNWFGT